MGEKRQTYKARTPAQASAAGGSNSRPWRPGVRAYKRKATAISISPYPDRNEAYGYLPPPGGLVITGPTHTHVNAFRVLLIL